MAGNSAEVVEFFNGSTYMKAVLVEEAPNDGALCCWCRDPLHGMPFYTTEPQIFDVHLRCAEYIYYCFFIHGQEKSSSPAPPADLRYKHGISSNKQLTGFQFPSQPQHNLYGNFYHAQPINFSYRPPPCYHQYPYYEQPPNPLQPQHNVYGNADHAQPMNFSYPPPPSYHPYPYNYGYGQPPNPSFPVPAVSQFYSYRPPAYGSGSGSGSINQQAAGNNEVWRPTTSGTWSAAGMLGSCALSAFLQALFGIILPISLPFGNT